VRDLPHVTFRDMYELYPDFVIDVEAEQQLLLEHDLIVWHHPFYWYSCPPLMKQWIDWVLEHGWAYGKTGDALSGKWVMNVLSSGGDFTAYQKEGRNHYTYRDFLAPLEQTALLCQMRYLPPLIVPGAHRITTEEVQRYALHYAEILHFLQSGPFDLEKLVQLSCFNELQFDAWQTRFYTSH
jgi:glutathione-regulated potassium-efflux system ancillary protein KefG